MKKYFFVIIWLTIFVPAFLQSAAQSITIQELGWTIKSPANEDDFTKDLLYKISVAVGHIRTVPVEMAAVADYKGEALSQSLIYRTEESYKDFLIGIGFETLNPAAFINKGWSDIFYTMVEQNSGTTTTSFDNGNDIDTSTYFETIGNSFFAVFKKKTTYKSSKYQSLNNTAYTLCTNRNNNKLMTFGIVFSDEKKGQDALNIIKNSIFTEIQSTDDQIPFTSTKNSIEKSLQALSFNKDLDRGILFSVEAPPLFNGDVAAWKRYLHCCIDQSVLAKDNVEGKRFRVKVKFGVAKDGQPCYLEVVNFPEKCPDCAIEALKLFYKHISPIGSNDKCNVITTAEPFKQWLPGINGARVANCYAYVTVPFGYEDEPENDKLISNNPKERLSRQKLMNSNNNPGVPVINGADYNKGVNKSDDNADRNDNADDDNNILRAKVISQNGKYILTLLKDNSTHTVFRPLPKNMDTAMVNKINAMVGINQGGWGEITKDKNGNQVVTFYSFTTAGSDKIEIQPVPIEVFKNNFYEPK